jgi:hypothetical protein
MKQPASTREARRDERDGGATREGQHDERGEGLYGKGWHGKGWHGKGWHDERRGSMTSSKYFKLRAKHGDKIVII